MVYKRSSNPKFQYQINLKILFCINNVKHQFLVKTLQYSLIEFKTNDRPI